jgi:hypothetical protein
MTWLGSLVREAVSRAIRKQYRTEADFPVLANPFFGVTVPPARERPSQGNAPANGIALHVPRPCGLMAYTNTCARHQKT